MEKPAVLLILAYPLKENRFYLLILAALMGVGLYLRASSLAFGLPNESRQDELAIMHVVMHSLLNPMMHGDWQLNPHFFIYPSLYLYVVGLCYLAYYGIGHTLGWFASWDHFTGVFYMDASSFHLILRWLSVITGTLCIPAMYLLGTSFFPEGFGFPEDFGKKVGLIGAALMATCYLCIRNSHFGTLDITVMLFIILSLAAILHFMDEKNPRNHWGASLRVGLTIALKYRAATLLIPLGLAIWHVLRQTEQKADQGKQFVTELLQVLGIVGVVFIFTSPWAVLDFRQFVQDISIETTKHFNYVVPGMEGGWTFYPRFALPYGLGILACLFSLVGIFRGSKVYPSSHHRILLVYLFSTYVLIGSNPLVMTRYALPLIPVILLYTAFGILVVAEWIGPLMNWRTVQQKAWLVSGLVGFVAFQPLMDAMALNGLLAMPDTRQDARAWILAHVKPGDVVATGPWYGRIVLPYVYYQLLVDPAHVPPGGEPPRLDPVDFHTQLTNTYANVGFLRQLKIRFVVLYAGLGMFANPPWEGAALEREAKLVAHWSPLPTEMTGPMQPLFDPFDAFYAPYAHFEGFQRGGPEIFIFDLAQKPERLPVQQGGGSPVMAPQPLGLPQSPREVEPPTVVQQQPIMPSAPPQPPQPKPLPLGEDGTVSH